MLFNNGQRFSIFDALEAKGLFRSNPANANARNNEGNAIYQGPVEYPKMLYHPTGERRILVPGSAEVGSLAGQYAGQYLNEQTEIIWKTVESKEEEEFLLAEGWHTHPAQAIEAGNRIRVKDGEKPLPVPAISSSV